MTPIHTRSVRVHTGLRNSPSNPSISFSSALENEPKLALRMQFPALSSSNPKTVPSFPSLLKSIPHPVWLSEFPEIPSHSPSTSSHIPGGHLLPRSPMRIPRKRELEPVRSHRALGTPDGGLSSSKEFPQIRSTSVSPS